jgi:mRNA-degrading endonuclease RelE of RelBE toxin-antitoxin system
MNDIEWKYKARKQLKKIPATYQAAIVEAVDTLQCDRKDWRNVIELKNHQYDYRLRVGRYRVLFNFEAAIEIVTIEEVKKRDERTY